MSSFDFESIWNVVQQAHLANNEIPAVSGGRFSDARPDEFLNMWLRNDYDFPWRIWAYTDSIEFGLVDEDISECLPHLLRTELFGPDGHLSLRRNGANRWQWRFVGPAGTVLPTELEGVLWQSKADSVLRRYEEKVILWGEEIRKKKDDPQTGIGRWWDDRVAAARLVYPPSLSSVDRVYLHFYRYTQTGHTVLVQYLGLGDQEQVLFPKGD